MVNTFCSLPLPNVYETCCDLSDTRADTPITKVPTGEFSYIYAIYVLLINRTLASVDVPESISISTIPTIN